MSESELRKAIVDTLEGFKDQPLARACTDLLGCLGYASERRVVVEPNSPSNFLSTLAPDKSINESRALLSDWRTADFLFQITTEEIQQSSQGMFVFDGHGKFDQTVADSFLFVAIDLKGDRYTRTHLAGITRELNQLFPQPVIVCFRHGSTITVSVIHRRLHKRDESRDVLERVTLIKDIRFADPHRAHVEILVDLSLGALYQRFQFTNFAGLHIAWQRALDSSELNKRFYQELANWYFWALDHVVFPKDAPKDRDGRDSLSLIRLITRLIFCWFLREKGLIPEDLFREAKVRSLLKSLKDNENTYYTAVLQNLFFATLNTEMDQSGKSANRRFIGTVKDGKDSEDHMIHQVWRYADRIQDKTLFKHLFRGIPFLNGGLFECLDERVEKGSSPYTREVRVDGFSVKPAKQPKVPNFLFFGTERVVDLSKAYGERRYTQAKVRPLISLLESYKFTVSENTPIEEEVALDPELLGHVFENLLAAYNPETDTAARKTTGSFYTPRVVVDFMVDESLLAYLKSRFQEAFPQAPDPEPRLRQLLAYTSEDHDFDDDEARVLVEAIDRVKILDPACGSGAFPMGGLHKLVFVLGKLDPGNAGWKELQLTKARQLDVGRDAAEEAIEDAFTRDQGNYARKLYLIENCLYGVDIQPIAVQIAKLRCFISLVVEQEQDEKLPNRGILPLPNLETKFIAANTLFGLHRRGQMALVNRDIEAKQERLRGIRHEHFLARRYSKKKALRKDDKKLRAELAALLKADQLSGPEAELLANWDPYHADRSAPFFDPEWMFNLRGKSRRAPATLLGNFSFINDTGDQMELVGGAADSAGFDIIIGNPPYVRQEELKKMRAMEGTLVERPLKEAFKDEYFCYTGTADLYVYFYEKAFDLLCVGGVLCFISSNKYFRARYGERLRYFLSTSGEVRLLIDFGDASVFTAIAYPSIVLVRKNRETRDKDALPSSVPKDAKKFEKLVPTNASVRALSWEVGPSIEEFPEIFAARGFTLPQVELTPDGWRLEEPVKLRLLEKLRKVGTPLGEFVEGHFYYGIKTGLNEAFVVDRATRDRLIAEHKSSTEVLKPFLRGRDVKRWRIDFSDQYLIKIESSENKRHPWSEKSVSKAEKIFAKSYPAVYSWFRPMRDAMKARYDKGHYYWELRSCAYYNEFESDKILYPDIYEHQSFVWDEDGFYAANTCYFIPTTEKWLTGLLNSLTIEWFYSLISNRIRGGYLRAFSEYMQQIPIPNPGKQTQKAIGSAVGKIQSAKKKDPNVFVGELEAEIDGLVAHLYGLKEEEYRTILDDLALSDPVRVGALNAYRETAKSFAK